MENASVDLFFRYLEPERSMVLILDGNLEIGAHVRSNLFHFIVLYNGSICACTVFCLPIFRRIKGITPPLPCPYGTEESVVLRGLTKETSILKSNSLPYDKN